MRVRPMISTWHLPALIAAFAMGTATDASARGVRVDDGPNFGVLGSILETTPVTSSPTAVDLAVFPVFTDDGVFDYPDTNLGFSVNYGQGQVSQLNVYKEGYLSFGSTALTTGVDTITGDLLNNVVAPFYLTGTSLPTSMAYTKGLVDSSAPFAVNEAVRTFRMTWTLDSSGSPFPFQVVLFDMSGLPGGQVGDFDMEFNYDSDPDFPTLPPAGSFLTAGFALGANILDPFGGPFTADQDYTFKFRNGVLLTTTSVPEPNSLALVTTGLFVLLAGVARRRRKGAPQPAR